MELALGIGALPVELAEGSIAAAMGQLRLIDPVVHARAPIFSATGASISPKAPSMPSDPVWNQGGGSRGRQPSGILVTLKDRSMRQSHARVAALAISGVNARA